jgi:peptidoglycan/xylan/chitin deacetylase (PgdA/CDA1 family)
VLGSGLVVAAGAAGGLAAPAVIHDLGPHRLPLGGGFAPAADHLDRVRTGRVDVIWRVATNRRAIALTFDDGPRPAWTPMVLDVLDELQAPATFFAVGENLRRYGYLYDGRLGRHELGNHTWTHADLATLDVERAVTELNRTAEQIGAIAGHWPTVLRPPFGHLGGAALLAAQQTGHDIVLWSRQAHESTFAHDPAGLVANIVDGAQPGDIVLCHDVGDRRRLVTLRNLGRLIGGFRDRGFELVTVSQLRGTPSLDVG